MHILQSSPNLKITFLLFLTLIFCANLPSCKPKPKPLNPASPRGLVPNQENDLYYHLTTQAQGLGLVVHPIPEEYRSVNSTRKGSRNNISISTSYRNHARGNDNKNKMEFFISARRDSEDNNTELDQKYENHSNFILNRVERSDKKNTKHFRPSQVLPTDFGDKAYAPIIISYQQRHPPVQNVDEERRYSPSTIAEPTPSAQPPTPSTSLSPSVPTNRNNNLNHNDNNKSMKHVELNGRSINEHNPNRHLKNEAVSHPALRPKNNLYPIQGLMTVEAALPPPHNQNFETFYSPRGTPNLSQLNSNYQAESTYPEMLLQPPPLSTDHDNENQGHFMHQDWHEEEVEEMEQLFDKEDRLLTKTVIGTKVLKKGTFIFVACMIIVILIFAGLAAAGLTITPVVFPFALLPIGIISLALFVPLLIIFFPFVAAGLGGEKKKRRKRGVPTRDQYLPLGDRRLDFLLGGEDLLIKLIGA